MRSIQWMTIATLTLLLCGCPPTTEPDEDMGGREDMGQTPDMNTPDEDMAMPPGEDMATEPDMGGDVDMKVEEDMRAGPLMLDCAPGFSKEATIPRGEGATFTVVFECSNTLEETEASSVAFENPIFVGHEGANNNVLSSSIAPQDDGDGTIIEVTVAAPAELAGLPQIPLTGIDAVVDGQEAMMLPASGPVTHLTFEKVGEIHSARAVAYHRTLSRPSTIFPTSWSVILERPAQPPTLLTLDYASGQKSLVSGEFGGVSTTLEMAPSDPFDATSWRSLDRADGGKAHYAVNICRPDVSNACAKTVDFTRVHTGKQGELVLFGGTGDVDQLSVLPFDASVGVVETEIVTGPIDPELRVLYSARDSNKGNQVWVIADAFTPLDDLGALTTERVGLIETIAGVTPAMVEAGKGSIGLIRSPKASMDESVPAGNNEVFAWTARNNPEGGTTFARAAISGGEIGGAFQERSIKDVEPGSASMQLIHWGKDGQAVLYTGADAQGIARAWVVALDPNTLTEAGPLYPIDFGLTYVVEPGDTLDVHVTTKPGSDTQAALFAVVFGLNNTKKDPEPPINALFGAALGFNNTKKKPETPLSALLVDTETSNLPATDPVIRPFASAPLEINEEGMPSGDPVLVAGGVATLAPIDSQKCKSGGCPTTVAVSPAGFEVQCRYDRGVQAVVDGRLEGNLSCDVVPPGENAQAIKLYESAPGYAFLMTKRAKAFETIGNGGGGGVPSHTIMFPIRRSGGLNALLEPGTEGILAIDVLEGVVQPPRELEIFDADGKTLDLAEVEILHYDTLTKRGVLVRRQVDMDGAVTTNQLAFAEDNGGIRVVAIIDVTYQNAGQQKPWTQCDGRAGCTIATTWDAVDFDSAGLAGGRGNGGVDVGGDGNMGDFTGDTTVAWVCEDDCLKEGDDGLICGDTSHFKPAAGGSGEGINLATSESEICQDLPVPVGVGSFLGGGGKQIILARQEPDDRTSFHLLMPVRRGDGSFSFRLVEHGSAPVRIDVLRDGRLYFVDVNEDGLLDIAFARDGEPGLGFMFNNGVDGFFNDEPVTVPGLSGLGVSGGRPFAGGPNPATSRNGKGTRKAASNSAARPELL